MSEPTTQERRALRVLWFHPRSLQPAQGGGELRVTGLIGEVVAQGHRVLVVQPGPLGASRPAGFQVFEVASRGGLGLAVAKIVARSPLRSPRVTYAGRRAAREQIAAFAPDVAVVSELLSWPVAAQLLPDVPWIFDAHNVEAEMYAELARRATGLFDKVTFGVDKRRIVRQEPEVARRADAVVAVSSEDARALRAAASLPRLPLVVPSSVPTPTRVSGPASGAQMLFVGTLNHPPNADAVRELVTSIVPQVRVSLPGARLVIVGRRPTAELRQLVSGADGVELIEDAPELASHYGAARCAVMPIRAGGGSRLKVYEALGHGLPVIGTTRALAGIPLPEDVVIRADSEDEMVSATLRVLTDDHLAAELSAAARDCFVTQLSWEHAAQPLLDLIEDLGGRG